jgi:lysyl-tRNA synthetase class 2
LFLDALQSGLPMCSGVALGVDRLLMLKLELEDITNVMSFSIQNA